MSRKRHQRKQVPVDQPQGRGWLWVVRVLILAAMIGSSYLAWAALGGERLPGCGPESGCDEVLSSRWARIFGIPVAWGALLVYGALGWAASGVRSDSPVAVQQGCSGGGVVCRGVDAGGSRLVCWPPILRGGGGLCLLHVHPRVRFRGGAVGVAENAADPTAGSVACPSWRADSPPCRRRVGHGRPGRRGVAWSRPIVARTRRRWYPGRCRGASRSARRTRGCRGGTGPGGSDSARSCGSWPTHPATSRRDLRVRSGRGAIPGCG